MFSRDLVEILPGDETPLLNLRIVVEIATHPIAWCRLLRARSQFLDNAVYGNELYFEWITD